MTGKWKSLGLVAMLALAACSGTSETAMDDTGTFDEGAAGGGVSSTGDGAGGLREGSEFGDEFGDEALSLDNRVIYFDFDKADVPGEYADLVRLHGEHLARNPGITVRLEGHADERGSREYNIGLGERRAQAVKQMLLLQGVNAVQLSTVSYGEERPAVLGSDEEAWALNRRVELVYVN